METAKIINIETIVNAPIDKVWHYWSAPEHITKWYQASDDWHAPKAENDLRTGGKFTTTMAARDGSMSFDFAGEYTEVIPEKYIAYQIADGRKVEISFTTDGSKTHIRESFEMETQNPEEMQRGGWQAILDSFKKHTEQN